MSYTCGVGFGLLYEKHCACQGDTFVADELVHRECTPAKRLPGLWFTCVLFGLGGMFSLSWTLVATPLGIAIFGSLAALSVALGIGLWVRSNIARLAATGFLALSSVFSILLGVHERDALALGAFGLCITAAIAAYLLFRRRYFRAGRGGGPGLLSASAAAASGLVIILGAGWTLLATVDDAPQRFPALELPRTAIPSDQNGFVVLQDMLTRFPAAEYAKLEPLEQGPPTGLEQGSEEWKQKAEEVLPQWDECLSEAGEMLSRPRFVMPAGQNNDDWLRLMVQDWTPYLRGLARLMSVKSKLLVMQGKTEQAMRTAQGIVDLGCLLQRGPNLLITYLVGASIEGIGLNEVREVAKSGGVKASALMAEVGHIGGIAGQKVGAVHALAGELAFMKESVRDVVDGEMLETEQSVVAAAARKLLKEPGRPVLKLNMTANLVGRELNEAVARLDHYRPEPPADQEHGLLVFVRRVGLLKVARDPVGCIYADLLRPALMRCVREHFYRLANERLTQVYLALRCYPLENGRLPRSLDDLAPKYFAQVPVDPFTEQPFLYEPDAAPPRLYSVGPDQKPDSEKKDDTIVELSFPPSRQ